jgi:hypothetical protein
MGLPIGLNCPPGVENTIKTMPNKVMQKHIQRDLATRYLFLRTRLHEEEGWLPYVAGLFQVKGAYRKIPTW